MAEYTLLNLADDEAILDIIFYLRQVFSFTVLHHPMCFDLRLLAETNGYLHISAHRGRDFSLNVDGISN
jgi:hypothetical protein